MLIQGMYTALVTPFTGSGELDLAGLLHNVRCQLKAGVRGIVLFGSTGESAAISTEERELAIRAVAQEVGNDLQFFVGAGTNDTRSTIRNVQQAERLGAHGTLIVTPYYNKPTQAGVVRHFQEIAQASALPILAYNNPGRSATALEVKTIKELSTIPSIVGIKDCSNSLSFFSFLKQTLAGRPEFSVMTGDDIWTFPSIACGGRGVISAIGNIVPDLMVQLVDLALAGNVESARILHYRLLPLIEAAYVESNPIAIKAIMAKLGMPAGPCRLPLTSLSQEHMPLIEKSLEAVKGACV